MDTGAIIITGETSRKENARAVLDALSDFAGEFVVATAGPDLESVLAAKGAGAVDYSQRTGKTVLHMDIGGGTSNLALIRDGKIERTGCLNVGGRLLKFDGGTVIYSGWQGGYRIIGILQVVLTVVLLFSLPLWKLPQDAMGGEPFTPQHRSFPELLKITGVPEVLVCFLCYCALESTAGMWASSYCTLVRGLDAQTAASWASLFYLGITAGRFVSGFLTMKMSDRNMIRLGQVLIALGILLVLLPAGNNVLFVGLILIGLGCAPVYPCIIHETPVNFGRELSMSMTGLQMAFAYVGSCLAPPLFGLLAQNVTPRLYPWYLAVGLVVMVIMSESLHAKKAAEHR